METIFIYILKVNVLVVLFYLVYQIALSRALIDIHIKGLIARGLYGENAYFYIVNDINPIYLKDDNTLYFKFSMKDLIRTKSKYPELFRKLSESNKAILNDNSEQSGEFLLVCKIKTD